MVFVKRILNINAVLLIFKFCTFSVMGCISMLYNLPCHSCIHYYTRITFCIRNWRCHVQTTNRIYASLRIIFSKRIRLSSNDSKLNIDNKQWKRILRVMIILPFQEYLRKRHRTCMMNFKESHYVFVKKCWFINNLGRTNLSINSPMK